MKRISTKGNIEQNVFRESALSSKMGWVCSAHASSLLPCLVLTPVLLKDVPARCCEVSPTFCKWGLGRGSNLRQSRRYKPTAVPDCLGHRSFAVSIFSPRLEVLSGPAQSAVTINTSAFVFCRHPEPTLGCPTELCHALLISSGADKNEISGVDPDEKRYN